MLPAVSEREPVSVVVMGCGAVGLPLAVAFADRGCAVVGVDVDPRRLAMLSRGESGERDPDLAKSLTEALGDGRLRFVSAAGQAPERRAFILTVPTPVDADGIPVNTHVEEAFAASVACAVDGDLVVVRSTVPIGTTRRLGKTIGRRRLLVASCPDRSLSGRSLSDQFSVPNIVGGVTADAARAASRLFARLGRTIEVASPETAEAVKLFANVQRDTIFAVANQFALISERLGLDYGEICRAAAEDYPRFLPTRPGPVGGPCLPKDVHLLADRLGDADRLVGLSLRARALNLSLLDHVVAALAAHLIGLGRAPRIAVVGLAFKGAVGTADRRGSFGVALVERLARDYPAAELRSFDPDASPVDPVRFAASADAVVLANEHPAIAALDLARVAAAMQPGGLIYDVCAGHRPPTPLPNGVRFQAFGNGAVAC